MSLSHIIATRHVVDLMKTALIMSKQIRNVVKCSLHNLGSEKHLKMVMSEKIRASKKISNDFRKNNGINKVCDITVDMMYGGMQDIPCIVCETSTVDKYEGIRLHGYSIPECCKLVPKARIGSQLLPEGLFWLLMTGDIPTYSQTEAISKEWLNRVNIQPHVITMINNFPINLHPMSQLSPVITTLSCKSKLRQAYIHEVHKTKYWEYVYEDVLDLIATLPAVVALMYQNSFKENRYAKIVEGDEDWSANLAKLLGYSSTDFADFLRLYICFCHNSDHGNTSTHAAHIVGSALSDPYLAFSSSINALAGPLLSNEKSLLFLKGMHNFVGNNPSDKQVNEFVQNAMNVSRHAMPEFEKGFQVDLGCDCFQEFGNKHIPEDPLFKLATQLRRLGHNHLVTVDVLAGVFLEFYEVKTNFHPVFMCLSHVIRVASSLVWDRAMRYPIEHPISMSTSCLMKACNHHDVPDIF